MRASTRDTPFFFRSSLEASATAKISSLPFSFRPHRPSDYDYLPRAQPYSIASSTTSHRHSQQLKMSTAELAASYAALILADDGVDITV